MKLRGVDRIVLVVSLLRTMRKAGCPTLAAMDMTARVAVVDCLSSGLMMRDGLSGFPLEVFREVCFASGFFCVWTFRMRGCPTRLLESGAPTNSGEEFRLDVIADGL